MASSDAIANALWDAANADGGLERALRNRAEIIARRAEQINRENGGTANYWVQEGFRPGGRRYFDVVSDNPEEEYGTEDVPRINALRRAARGE